MSFPSNFNTQKVEMFIDELQKGNLTDEELRAFRKEINSRIQPVTSSQKEILQVIIEANQGGQQPAASSTLRSRVKKSLVLWKSEYVYNGDKKLLNEVIGSLLEYATKAEIATLKIEKFIKEAQDHPLTEKEMSSFRELMINPDWGVGRSVTQEEKNKLLALAQPEPLEQPETFMSGCARLTQALLHPLTFIQQPKQACGNLKDQPAFDQILRELDGIEACKTDEIMCSFASWRKGIIELLSEINSKNEPLLLATYYKFLYSHLDIPLTITPSERKQLEKIRDSDEKHWNLHPSNVRFIITEILERSEMPVPKSLEESVDFFIMMNDRMRNKYAELVDMDKLKGLTLDEKNDMFILANEYESYRESRFRAFVNHKSRDLSRLPEFLTKPISIRIPEATMSDEGWTRLEQSITWNLDQAGTDKEFAVSSRRYIPLQEATDPNVDFDFKESEISLSLDLNTKYVGYLFMRDEEGTPYYMGPFEQHAGSKNINLLRSGGSAKEPVVCKYIFGQEVGSSDEYGPILVCDQFVAELRDRRERMRKNP